MHRHSTRTQTVYARSACARVWGGRCLFLLLALLLGAGLVAGPGASCAHAASAASLFNKAHSDFHSLTKNARKAKYRDQWLRVADEFEDCYKKDTDGSYAPKSLYYLGRVYEELGRRSALQSDFRTADEYYSKVISRFPRHGWADDCLYRRAKVRIDHRNWITYGTRDLERIVKDYPRSDMYPEAVTMLKRMGKSPSAVAAASRPDPPAKKPSSGGSMKKASQAASRTADPSNLAHLQEIRYTSSSEYTRVVLDLDEHVKYHFQHLSERPEYNRPHRLYIDLDNTAIGNDIHRNVLVSDGILQSIRSAQNDTETTRVVLDFHDMQNYKVFHLKNPFRVVVDVYAPEGQRGTAGAPVTTSLKKTPSGGSRPARPAKRATGSTSMAGDLVKQLGLTIKTIMIDPGHGGKDPGATAFGILEKDINLKVGLMLGKMLKEKGFNVLYTRTTDKFVPLEERTAIANVKKADMFISLHVNAHRSSSISGIEIYTLNLARTADAKRVAARENSVDPKQISDLQFILTDLVLNSKLKESTDLAKDIQKSILTRLNRSWKVKNNGVREAPFYVLMGAKMPAVLVEMGYVTNRSEAKRLRSDHYQEQVALGVLLGVLDYKAQIEQFAGL